MLPSRDRESYMLYGFCLPEIPLIEQKAQVHEPFFEAVGQVSV